MSNIHQIDPYALVYPERSTFRLFLKVSTSGIEKDLVKFELVRLCERFFGQRSRLGVSLAKFLRFDPIFKILARFPKRKYDVGVIVIDRTQHLVGDEAGHPVDESSAIAETFLKGFSIFGRDVDSICDSYHGFALRFVFV